MFFHVVSGLCIICHSLFNSTAQSLKMEVFENILGEGENAGNQHFLLLPKCFLSVSKQALITF